MVEAAPAPGGFCLLGLAAGVVTLRGPARGADDKPRATVGSPVVTGRRPSGRNGNGRSRSPRSRPAGTKPIEPVYVPENMAGLVAFRPAATFRRAGMAHFATRLREAAVALACTITEDDERVDASKPER